MHDQYPHPPELTEAQTNQLARLYEDEFGEVMATYTPTVVTVGNHPDAVKEAWRGVPMPVRRYFAGAVESGSVPIAAGEAFNALVASGAPEEVLQYWIDRLPEDPYATLQFALEDGSLSTLGQ